MGDGWRGAESSASLSALSSSETELNNGTLVPRRPLLFESGVACSFESLESTFDMVNNALRWLVGHADV